MTTEIMRTTTRTVLPLILVVAISLFLQGHNLPGGGFIGGVLATTGFALIYITYGLDFLDHRVLGRDVAQPGSAYEERIVYAYRRTFVFGLVVAAASGFAAVLLGFPFLTQSYVIVHDIPLYHELEIASAIVFDLGVFCVVVGGLLTVLSVVGAE